MRRILLIALIFYSVPETVKPAGAVVEPKSYDVRCLHFLGGVLKLPPLNEVQDYGRELITDFVRTHSSFSTLTISGTPMVIHFDGYVGSGSQFYIFRYRDLNDKPYALRLLRPIYNKALAPGQIAAFRRLVDFLPFLNSHEKSLNIKSARLIAISGAPDEYWAMTDWVDFTFSSDFYIHLIHRLPPELAYFKNLLEQHLNQIEQKARAAGDHPDWYQHASHLVAGGVTISNERQFQELCLLKLFERYERGAPEMGVRMPGNFAIRISIDGKLITGITEEKIPELIEQLRAADPSHVQFLDPILLDP